MSRRPPGHVAPQRRYLWATLLVVLVPWLQLVDAQQQQPRQPGSAHQLQSPPEGDQHVAPNLAATAVAARQFVETPRIYERRKTTIVEDVAASNDDDLSDDTINKKNNNNDIYIPHDVRAHTLAPDLSVRAPPPSTNSLGLSQQLARSLEDWRVEDFVLLATVDGDLYASDRKTGHERWHYKADRPMVETRHFRTSRSILDDDYDPLDHFIWVVEPTRDGELYLWRPNEDGTGLAKLPWTMKKVVEVHSPLWDGDILYTGDKKTTMVTFNAATGTLISEFGSGGSYVNNVDTESCHKPSALADEEDECSNSGTITLGRTDYTVTIHRTKVGPVASLKYSEWGPNTRDNDLIQQNIITKDQCYVAGKHDGSVYGFDFGDRGSKAMIFKKTLESPVARVFDVLRRWRTAPGIDPELVVLPQPPLPESVQDMTSTENEKVLLNQTLGGSWYAMSKSRYPLISEAPMATVDQVERWKVKDAWELGNADLISKALVGVHRLPAGRGLHNIPKSTRLTIDAPPEHEKVDPGPDPPRFLPPNPEPSNIFETAKRLPGMAAGTAIDLVANPIAICLAIIMLWRVYKEDLLHLHYKLRKKGNSILKQAVETKLTLPLPTPEPTTEPTAPPSEQPVSEPVEPVVVRLEVAKPEVPGAPPTPPAEEPTPFTETISGNVAPVVLSPGPTPPPPLVPAKGLEGGAVAETPKKKKGHRGRRGGVKHKKNGSKNNEIGSNSRDDEPPLASVDEVVSKAKQLGAQPALEPDIMTIPGNTDEVSGHIIRMGGLEVNEAEQLGTGSNGTVVFSGKWEGRDVAVKRMLVQFNEIASQETKLLRESDDHPNVIRYYAQQQRASFLYIALELCQASLADVIQKPSSFRELAMAGERDMPGVLYQIANGLSHLHNLRIVHRDLKPQNILVNMGRDGRPRVLVSDFGLCKKLEGGQSSFGATTAHAAGTTGWRAPELLIDDDAPGTSMMALTDPGSSFHSGSGITGPEGSAPFSRRVTRAIDIFSLGLVYFYVLTRGSHPFDCGDRFMREVNIRKGHHDLRLLDSLGDFAFEAHDLISSMLAANPKQRPTAADVMSHPFFWSSKKRLAFLCDVSDHFEKEPRDPPSPALSELERHAPDVVKGDFLKQLPRDFVDSLGKQRKYTGTRMLDLLRALRNKRNHYEDLSDALKKMVGPLPDGYLVFWTSRFPNLLTTCWNVIYDLHCEETDRFRDYYLPAPPSSM